MYSKEEIEKNKEIIKNIIKENPTSYSAILKNKKNLNILKFIIDMTPKLNDKFYSLSTKVFWVLNDLTDFPICPICKKTYGQNINIVLNRGYSKTCSVSCGSKNGTIKRKNTSLIRYGVDNPMKTKEVKEKLFKTCLKKYGTKIANQFSTKELHEKYKNNCLKKYGKETPYISQPNKTKIKEKIKQTCLQKYGVEHVFKSEKIKEKIKQTWLKKYGVDNPNKNKKVREKLEKTNLERYGNIVSTKSQLVKDKAKNTFINKYGVTSPMQLNEFKIKNEIAKAKRQFNKFFTNTIPLFDFHTYFEHRLDCFFEYDWKCSKCNTIFKAPINKNWFRYTRDYSRCTNCFPIIGGISHEESELSNFIKTIYNGKIILNSRQIIKPLELDIYLPEKKLAIEFDGLYFHSEKTTITNDYHLIKTKLCEEQGIQLIHIFENEWRFKRHIVESRFKNLLGIYESIVYARKCKVKIVNKLDTDKFLNENHIQGTCISKINLGLFYKDKLISIMTFGKSRFNKKYQWELLRFCNLCNYHIPGAASKLLNYFEKIYKPQNIISYADRRWSIGTLYKTLKFQFIRVFKT